MGGAAPAAAWGWAPQGHGAPLQPPQGTPRPDFCTWVGIAASEVGCPIQGGRGTGKLLVVRPGQALGGVWDTGGWGSEDSHAPEH